MSDTDHGSTVAARAWRPVWRRTYRRAGLSTSASASRHCHQPRAAGSRSGLPFRERHPRHGPGAGAEEENPWLINASTRVSLRPGGSYVHHADSFAHGARRPSRPVRARRASRWPRTATSPTGRGRGPRRPRRSAAPWTWRPAQARLGGDGTHDQGRPATPSAALRLPADGGALRQPRLHRLGRAGRHASGFLGCRHGPRPDLRRTAGADGSGAAPGLTDGARRGAAGAHRTRPRSPGAGDRTSARRCRALPPARLPYQQTISRYPSRRGRRGPRWGPRNACR